MRIVKRGNIRVAQELIARVKNLVHRHDAFRDASELEGYVSRHGLPDGSSVTIASMGGMKNVTILGAEKMELERRELPPELYNAVLIWVGLRDKGKFPISIFRRLSQWWLTPVFDTPYLPIEELFKRRLLFIFAPKRKLTASEAKFIRIWMSGGNRVIIQLGEWDINSTVPGIIRQILDQLNSKLSIQNMWSRLEGNFLVYNKVNDLPTVYAGYSSGFKFNNIEGPFIATGGPFSVDVDESLWAATDPVGIPYAVNQVFPMLYRGSVSWPSSCGDGSTPYPKNWHDDYDPDIDWTSEELNNIRDLYAPDGWFKVEILAAHHDNIMILCFGPHWFTNSNVDDNYFKNRSFAIGTLLQRWRRPNDPQPLSCTYIWADCSGISFSIPIQTGPIDYEEFPEFLEGE